VFYELRTKKSAKIRQKNIVSKIIYNFVVYNIFFNYNTLLDMLTIEQNRTKKAQKYAKINIV
jgi:hypothetical protein